MKLLERLFVVLALCTTGAFADPVDMKPFRANYVVEWKGISAANSSIESVRAASGSPLVRMVNAGNSSVPKPTTGTLNISRCSSVRGRSRNDLAPAHTVTTG